MKPLKLHVVRVSPCCRVVWLYLLQNGISFELEDVDVFGRMAEDGNSNYVLADNDHRRLPVLELEGEQRISGGVPCLRYLETKFPKNRKGWSDDPHVNAKIHAVLDWAASELHIVIGYKFVYPQFFDEPRHPGDAKSTEMAINNATRKVVEELEAIEKKYFSAQDSSFLCGDVASVADTYVATIIVQLEWVESMDMKLWSKLNRWLKEVRKQEYWDEVHGKHKEFVESLKNVPLEST